MIAVALAVAAVLATGYALYSALQARTAAQRARIAAQTAADAETRAQAAADRAAVARHRVEVQALTQRERGIAAREHRAASSSGRTLEPGTCTACGTRAERGFSGAWWHGGEPCADQTATFKPDAPETQLNETAPHHGHGRTR